MIEISVSGLKKSFEIGNNILDGVTFQVETGERVGLLGRNGAGKSTLFRILTGELDADEGDVVIARNRRLGLISQIPIYPVGFTVEDVLQTAFSRHRKLSEEMERLTAAMAAGDSSEETLRRYGELAAKFEGIGGERFDEIANQLKSCDTYMALADFDSYRSAQARVSALYRDPAAFARVSLYNIAGAGIFSADRAIREYADEIWHLD